MLYLLPAETIASLSELLSWREREQLALVCSKTIPRFQLTTTKELLIDNSLEPIPRKTIIRAVDISTKISILQVKESGTLFNQELMRKILHHLKYRNKFIVVKVHPQQLESWRKELDKVYGKVLPLISLIEYAQEENQNEIVPMAREPSTSIGFTTPSPEDIIKTPESVRVQLLDIKYHFKRLYAQSNNYEIRASYSPRLPTAVLPLLKNKNYQFPPEASIDFTSLTRSDVESTIINYCKTFTRAIIYVSDHWFMIHGFDIFLHKQPLLDDCADFQEYKFSLKPTVKIKSKNNKGRYYYELSIFIGDIELLSTAGYHGSMNGYDKTLFLGTSIASIPPESEIIHHYHRMKSSKTNLPKCPNCT